MSEEKSREFSVIETACYPNAWKIQAEGCRVDNSTSNFYPSYQAAVDEIKSRGGTIRFVAVA